MIVVERLSVRVWLLTVFPRLLSQRFVRGGVASVCYFIDGSRLAILVSRVWGRLVGASVERLSFRLVDIRDEAGLAICIRLAYRDLFDVQADVVREPAFQSLVANCGTGTRLPLYASKSAATFNFFDRTGMGRALLLVQVARWTARAKGIPSAPTLILERRPWSSVIRRYASREGVTAVDVRPAIAMRGMVRGMLAPRGVLVLKAIRDRLAHRWLLRSRMGGANTPASPGDAAPRSDPQLAVSYHGQFNLDEPAQYSDLFFWQESELDGRDILLLFEFRQDALDEEKWRQLKERGIGAVALYPGATIVREVPLHTHFPNRTGAARPWSGRRGWRCDAECRWLRSTVANYDAIRERWRDLFASQHVKVYLTWYRFDARHMAIADAARDVGGVSAIYQRASQPDAGPQITVGADVMFGYAPADADVERRSGSVIPYHVAVGYFGDHRFPLLRGEAARVRSALMAHGASYLVAYLDENSADDSRWHTGHEFMRENYDFVLEKLLADERLGLILKPKYPSNLRRRLGPVAASLDRALATGRCYMFDSGPLHGSYPPAVAALAADVVIHGHLSSPTAGFEAALAGVPTLLLDREGWHPSEMFRLGEGRVAFRDWHTLWRAVSEQRARPGCIPGFGDWSPMMDELDPFRDGHAAERVGTYLQWLLEGFKAHRDRETVLAETAERYCDRWGADKVTAVGTHV